MSNALRPLILVRGRGGNEVSDDQASPCQGFNDRTVYPPRRGENYIYEGSLAEEDHEYEHRPVPAQRAPRAD